MKKFILAYIAVAIVFYATGLSSFLRDWVKGRYQPQVEEVFQCGGHFWTEGTIVYADGARVTTGHRVWEESPGVLAVDTAGWTKQYQDPKPYFVESRAKIPADPNARPLPVVSDVDYGDAETINTAMKGQTANLVMILPRISGTRLLAKRMPDGSIRTTSFELAKSYIWNKSSTPPYLTFLARVGDMLIGPVAVPVAYGVACVLYLFIPHWKV